MYNFYVVLAGHDMVTDASRATTCRRKFKAPSLQTNCTKNEGPPENMGFKGKTVWRFQTKKKNRNIIPDLSKKLSGIQELWARQLNKALVESKK